VYESEAATNFRNRGIAHLFDSYGRMYCDPDDATDVYTRQCSLSVSARDLAVMAATLADGGVNPITGERVIEASNCKRVLAVLATAGLYERSGDWLFEVGHQDQPTTA
jgi:glutaminase